MRRKILGFLAGLCGVAGVACANPFNFTAATIQTNGAVQVTQTPDSDGFVTGYIEGVLVDITAGKSETNTVTLTTLADGYLGSARTILTLSNVTGDGYYAVRDLVTGQTGVDVTGEPARIPLVQDKLRLTAISSGADTNTTACTFTLRVFVTDKP